MNYTSVRSYYVDVLYCLSSIGNVVAHSFMTGRLLSKGCGTRKILDHCS